MILKFKRNSFKKMAKYFIKNIKSGISIKPGRNRSQIRSAHCSVLHISKTEHSTSTVARFLRVIFKAVLFYTLSVSNKNIFLNFSTW